MMEMADLAEEEIEQVAEVTELPAEAPPPPRGEESMAQAAAARRTLDPARAIPAPRETRTVSLAPDPETKLAGDIHVEAEARRAAEAAAEEGAPILGFQGEVIGRGEPVAPAPADVWEVDLQQMDAPQLSGLTRDIGLFDEGSGADLALLDRAEWIGIARLREAEAAPFDQMRAQAAQDAMNEWRGTVARQIKLATEGNWRPNRLAWLGMGKADPDLQVQWAVEQQAAFRDDGVLHPDLNPDLPPAGVFAERRAVSVSAMREGLPANFGDWPRDELLEAQRPETMDTILLSERDRHVLGTSREEAFETPVDVHLQDLYSPADLDNLVRDVMVAHPQGDTLRIADPDAEVARLAESAARREALREEMAVHADRLTKTPKKIAELRAAGHDKLAGRELEALEMTRRRVGELENEYAGIQRAEQMKPDLRSSMDVLADLYVGTGYGAMGRVLREGLDPRAALHVVESTVSSMQRLAVAAASDGATATHRAAAIRALHQADAVIQHVRGHDRAAASALRRARLPVEQRYLDDMDAKIARRVTDHRLISQSGGTTRVQARLAGLALTKDVREAMVHLNAWRRDASVAWNLGRKLGVNNIPRAAMMVRMGGLLSRPGGWTANKTGNAFMQAMVVPERFVAETLMGIGKGRTQTMPQSIANAFRESNDLAIGMLGGWSDHALLWREDFRLNMGSAAQGARAADKLRAKNLRILHYEFDAMDKFESSADFTVSGIRRDLAHKPDTRKGALADGFARFMHGAFTHGISVNRAADMFFKSSNFRGEMNRLAWKKAREEFDPNVDEAAFKARAAELSARPSDDMFQQAVKFAHTNTFTAEGIAAVEWYTRAVKRYPGLRHMTPIIRTPANVVTEGIKRMPGAGLLIKTEWDAFQKGGLARREVLARQMVGAFAYATLLNWWQNNGITGSEPLDPGERAAWRALKKKPYSIRLPFTNVQLDYRYLFGPFALPIITTLDAISHLSAWAGGEEELGGLQDLATYAASMLGFVADETFLGDLFDWADLAMGDLSPDRLERLLRRQAVSYAPLSSNMRAIAREFATDQVVHDYTRSGGLGGGDEPWSEKLVEGLTAAWLEAKGLYMNVGDVYPRRDHHGRELRLVNTGGSFLSWLAPTRYTVLSTDPLDEAEHEVMFKPTWLDRNVVVRHPDRTLPLSETVELTPREFDRFQQMAGEEYRKEALTFIQGRGWRDSIPAKRQGDLGRILMAARHRVRKAMRLPESERHFPDLHEAMRASVARLTAESERQRGEELRARMRGG